MPGVFKNVKPNVIFIHIFTNKKEPKFYFLIRRIKPTKHILIVEFANAKNYFIFFNQVSKLMLELCFVTEVRSPQQ